MGEEEIHVQQFYFVCSFHLHKLGRILETPPKITVHYQNTTQYDIMAGGLQKSRGH